MKKLTIKASKRYDRNAFLNLKRFRIGRKSCVILIVDKDKEDLIELEIKVKEERQ
jgi:hypothetical protein